MVSVGGQTTRVFIAVLHLGLTETDNFWKLFPNPFCLCSLFFWRAYFYSQWEFFSSPTAEWIVEHKHQNGCFPKWRKFAVCSTYNLISGVTALQRVPVMMKVSIQNILMSLSVLLCFSVSHLRLESSANRFHKFSCFRILVLVLMKQLIDKMLGKTCSCLLQSVFYIMYSLSNRGKRKYHDTIPFIPLCVFLLENLLLDLIHYSCLIHIDYRCSFKDIWST